MVPVPASTGPPGYDVGRRFQRAHVSKEPRHGKDGPQCRQYGFSCVELLCAGRQKTCTSVTPRRAIEQDGKDVGLVARARSRSSLCRFSCVSLVQGRSVTLPRFFDSDQKQIEKIYRYQIQLKIGLNSLFSTKGDLCPSSDNFKFSTLYTGYCTLYTGYCTY